MPSNVDKGTSPVAIAKLHYVSNGVNISRLDCGEFAIAVHDGPVRAVVQASRAELLVFATKLLALAESP